MESEQIVPEVDQQAVYAYEPLLLDPPTIRVLNINPVASHGTPIELTLIHIPLTDDHTCLSYMWGDSKDREVTYINSRRFEVGRNLYDFLSLARTLNITDRLWVDAICINQENVPERNTQVQLMGDIYESASQVLIYPGRLPKGLGNLSPWKRNPPELSLQEIDAMPYWRRTWIVQEILLAQKASVVTGEGSIDWPAFTKLFPGSGHIGRLAQSASQYKKLRHREETRFILGHFSDTQCSDVRDRIYATRALVREYADVAVNYSEDEAAMLIRVAAECVLRKLEHADHGAGIWMLQQHLHGLRNALGVSIEITCATCFQGLSRIDQEMLWDGNNGLVEQLTWEHLLIKATKSPESTMTGDIGVHDHRCGRCGRRRTGPRFEVFARGTYSVWIRIPRQGLRARLWGRK